MEEFQIPVSRDDLLKKSYSKQYSVHDIVPLHNINSHLRVCEDKLDERGYLFIYEMFDYVYSVLHHWVDIDMKYKEKCWLMLLKSCQKSMSIIVPMIDRNLSNSEQFLHRNCIKMNLYLLCQMIDLFENSLQKVMVAFEKGKGKKKKPVSTTQTSLVWEDEVECAVSTMIQLFQCKIEKFWDPPVVEEDFINVICNSCYKLLENPSFCKNAVVRKDISKLLIKMVIHYNHSVSCAMKLVQLLHCFPHIGSCLVIICKDFLDAGLNMTVRDILKEICSYSSLDLDHNNQATTAFSSFLSDFSSSFPMEIIPLLPELRNKLNDEPYTLRNCVLTVMGEVITQIYAVDPAMSQKRDLLLDVIEEHMTDINGFVRAKALAIILMVVEKQKPSLSRQIRIMKQLVGPEGAIYDTSSFARKYTIRILACLARNNIAKDMSSENLMLNLQEMQQELAEVEQKLAEMPSGEDTSYIERQIEQVRLSNQIYDRQPPLQSRQVAREILEKEIFTKKGVIYIIQQTIELADLFQIAITDMQCMLASKVQSDIMEAVDFFVHAKLAGVPNVDGGIRKMLLHISSKDTSLKSAVTTAYRSLYMSTDEDDHRDKATLIIDSLTELIRNTTYGEMMCIEQLICSFCESGEFDESAIGILWRRFTAVRSADFSAIQRKNALIIFSVVASVHQGCSKNYFQSLINDCIPTVGLTTIDLQLIDYLCRSIQNMVNVQVPAKNAEPIRLPKEHLLFKKLIDLCLINFSIENKPCWIPMTNEVIATIYLLAENPDVICSEFITAMAKEIIRFSKENNDPVAAENSSQQFTVPSYMLTRFIDVSGHTALKQFIHLDVATVTELKRRNAIQEEESAKKNVQQKIRDKKRQTTTSVKTVNDNTNLEEEMGLVGATADDAEAEFIKKICENEVINDPSKLFHKLFSLIVFVCKNFHKFKDPDLQKISSLALSKMMMISSKMCMEHIDLLFELAARSELEVIRANLIVPIGDLIRRFTTSMEPYTPLFYARLRDQSSLVRLNALNVISHLILNDMIKVKGQISDVTTCIIDSHPRIVHLAKIFFQELANKDKALYNVMPDIISRLSNPTSGVPETDFRIIMEYLTPFITKKNQCENLFEKICARFHASNEERNWRDLSFCLSLMTFNDNMLKYLHLNLNSFGGKLHIKEVYDSLKNIIINAKKTTKGGELETLLDEMDTKLDVMRDKGIEDAEVDLNAERAALKKQKKFRRTKETSRRIIPRSGQSRANLELFSDDSDTEKTPEISTRALRNNRKRRTVVDFDDSD